jgi:hypothetical protein
MKAAMFFHRVDTENAAPGVVLLLLIVCKLSAPHC